jgi:sugar (pentulose or hexulose) kinase
MTAVYFLGIDIGTQGARVVLMDSGGDVKARAEEGFPLSDRSREEQSPLQWWEVCLRLLKTVLDPRAVDPARVKAVAVTSTSGTVIPLDGQNRPLYNAIMYSDQRSGAEAALCKAAANAFHPGGYSGFNTSSGLSKMVWFVRTFPGQAARLSKWAHAADYITGMLSGCWGITDQTNALKSGFDAGGKYWPSYIHEQLPLKKEWLPEVVASGTPVGPILPALAAELRLRADVQVVAGITDGCASQISSGAVRPGDWNTTIGTTMVIKGVTLQEISDPDDVLYSHRHPEGYWMPGGASNTGSDWVAKEFGGDLALLNEQAAALIPTGIMAWPLVQQGERFPIAAPQARGFSAPDLSGPQRFASNMEGVAYVERYAYEMIRKLSGEHIKAVFTAGGASNSETWLKIRSNVLRLPIYKMRHVTGAVGAAILAASRTHFTNVMEACQAMTQVDKEIFPDAELSAAYEVHYRRFIQTLIEKGYIREGQHA